MFINWCYWLDAILGFEVLPFILIMKVIHSSHAKLSVELKLLTNYRLHMCLSEYSTYLCLYADICLLSW